MENTIREIRGKASYMYLNAASDNVYQTSVVYLHILLSLDPEPVRAVEILYN